MALSCTTLKIRPFRVNQSAITLNGDGQCRAEPWNRTTPYELEARHALFTLVPLMPRLFAGDFSNQAIKLRFWNALPSQRDALRYTERG